MLRPNCSTGRSDSTRDLQLRPYFQHLITAHLLPGFASDMYFGDPYVISVALCLGPCLIFPCPGRGFWNRHAPSVSCRPAAQAAEQESPHLRQQMVKRVSANCPVSTPGPGPLHTWKAEAAGPGHTAPCVTTSVRFWLSVPSFSLS